MAYIVGSLKGNALAWASALWDSDSPVNDNFDLFVAEMRKVFDHPVEGGDAAKRLISLCQGSRSVAEFSVEFRTYAARSGWNDKALRGLFLSGLSESIKDELATREEADTLDELISFSIRLDNRLRERRRERTVSSVPPALSTPCSPNFPCSPCSWGALVSPKLSGSIGLGPECVCTMLYPDISSPPVRHCQKTRPSSEARGPAEPHLFCPRSSLFTLSAGCHSSVPRTSLPGIGPGGLGSG